MNLKINPAKIDFVTLRLFCAIARSGSITKGAEECNLALSAASRRISDFEETVGTALFERSAKGVSLTQAGHVVIQHALRLFQGFEQLSNELSEYSKGMKGHVRLWANMSALTEFLPAALSSFLNKHPEIQVEVEEQLSGDIVRALHEGFADIGVFADGTITTDLDTKILCQDELFVVCAQQHPISTYPSIEFKECLKHDFVGLNRGSSLLELTLRNAEKLGLQMKLRVQVRSYNAMCEMIAANLGIGILPIQACRTQVNSMGLQTIKLNEAWAKRNLLIATKSGALLSPAASLLQAHLKAAQG